MQPAGQQHVAGLAAEEGHRMAGVDRRAHHRAGRAVHPARQIDGDHRGAARVHRLDHGARQTLDLAVEPGAEQCVDDDVAVGERDRGRLLERSAPALGRQRSIALEPPFLADEADADGIAALGQKARGDKAVAAVVAGPGHNHHATALQHGADRVGDRPAGIFHQLDAGSAAGDGQPVGFCHFGRGEEFDHRIRHYRPAGRPTNRSDCLPRSIARPAGKSFCRVLNC